MQWKKRPVPPQEVRRLHEQYGLDLLCSSILARRGVTEREQVKYYLESELSYLHNPFLFDDMESVVDRLNQAIDEKEKIRIFGDRDVDGITSTTLMVEELQRLGADVSYKLPEGDEPYGMTISGVEKAHEDGVTLIITVDCGISSFEETAKASSYGMDTLVFDHHLSSEQLPPALAIIDPKVEGCGYPFEHLAACGVVSKVIWALRFSRTAFYHEGCILLHAQPGNQTVVIQAVRLENLVETGRVYEELNPGVVDLEKSKAVQFLSGGMPILVLDKDIELNQLKTAFGKSVDISLVDMRPEMEKLIPVIKGKSLFTLSTLSHSARYTDHGRDELEALIALFNAFILRKYPELDEGYSKTLDLTAIGTIADLMPMLDENRLLVKRGLLQIEKNPRPSLLPLLSMQKLTGKELTSQDISWQLSPVLNAAGRMGKPVLAVDMLLSKDPMESQKYALQLLDLNKQRQKLGEDAWDRLLPQAQESFEQSGSKIVMVEDPTLPRGITGLMASRLLKKYNVPCLVLADVDERISASMRSPQSFNSRDFLSLFSDLFQDFGGHACAGGFSMDKGNLDELKKRVVDEVDRMDCLENEDDDVEIDCSLPPKYLTPDIIREVEFFEPYGEKNPPIVFSIEKARISDIQILNNSKGGDQHVKLTLDYGTFKWPAYYWSAGSKVGKDFSKDDTVDVAFRLSRNYFRLQSSLQLTVVDLKKSS